MRLNKRLMKYIFLLITFACVVTSCTKTKTNTVTVTKYDTVTTTVNDTIAVNPVLIGTWKSSTGISPIIIGSSTYQVQSFPAVRYIASLDTIYDYSQSTMAYASFAYSISKNNDTLWLLMLNTPGATTNVYTRN